MCQLFLCYSKSGILVEKNMTRIFNQPQLMNQDLWILQLLGSQPQTPHCSSSHEGSFNISKPSTLSQNYDVCKFNYV
jgi:hypothetical protein